MEKLTVSQAIAQQLKDAGWKHETVYSWNFSYSMPTHAPEMKGPFPYLCESAGYADEQPAPTAQEITDVLPKLIGKTGFLDICYPVNLWLAGYTSKAGKQEFGEPYASADTIADALALLWIKLQGDKQ